MQVKNIESTKHVKIKLIIMLPKHRDAYVTRIFIESDETKKLFGEQQ